MKLTITQAITRSVRLNLAVTRSNLNNDSELILMIANIFVKDLPAKVLSLQSAFDRKDRNGALNDELELDLPKSSERCEDK